MAISCQAPPAVLLAPEAAGLESAVRGVLPRGTKVEVEGRGGVDRNVIRLSSTPGWNLPSGVGADVPLPADWNPSYTLPPSLAALGRKADGSWSSVPVLYDVWGETSFAAPSPSAPPPGDWSALLKGAARDTLVAAGARPSFRQAAFLFQVFPDLPESSEALAWFDQTPLGWRAPGAVFPAVIANRAWRPNTWFFSRADQAAAYKPGRPTVFLETYRDYESTNAPGLRRFAPLVANSPGGYALAGTVLFLEYRGDARSLDRALPLMKSLTGPGFARKAGLGGKWLAADRAAEELDGVGAMLRRRVGASVRFLPVTDRLPDPLVEGSLWVEVQLAVDRAPRS
ncbi:MAG: hypothetical protein M0Z80_02355 [Treponema sp.]|nr:hypothetical protein [Treponema sp.]